MRRNDDALTLHEHAEAERAIAAHAFHAVRQRLLNDGEEGRHVFDRCRADLGHHFSKASHRLYSNNGKSTNNISTVQYKLYNSLSSFEDMDPNAQHRELWVILVLALVLLVSRQCIVAKRNASSNCTMDLSVWTRRGSTKRISSGSRPSKYPSKEGPTHFARVPNRHRSTSPQGQTTCITTDDPPWGHGITGHGPGTSCRAITDEVAYGVHHQAVVVIFVTFEWLNNHHKAATSESSNQCSLTFFGILQLGLARRFLLEELDDVFHQDLSQRCRRIVCCRDGEGRRAHALENA